MPLTGDFGWFKDATASLNHCQSHWPTCQSRDNGHAVPKSPVKVIKVTMPRARRVKVACHIDVNVSQSRTSVPKSNHRRLSKSLSRSDFGTKVKSSPAIKVTVKVTPKSRQSRTVVVPKKNFGTKVTSKSVRCLSMSSRLPIN